MKSLKDFRQNEIKKGKQSKVNGAWGFTQIPTGNAYWGSEEGSNILSVQHEDYHYDADNDGVFDSNEYMRRNNFEFVNFI